MEVETGVLAWKIAVNSSRVRLLVSTKNQINHKELERVPEDEEEAAFPAGAHEGNFWNERVAEVRRAHSARRRWRGTSRAVSQTLVNESGEMGRWGNVPLYILMPFARDS